MAHVRERPWLTREAAAQIAGPEGRLGPLFAEVELAWHAPARTITAELDGSPARIVMRARADDGHGKTTTLPRARLVAR